MSDDHEEPDNHYGELREVYTGLIDDHREAKQEARDLKRQRERNHPSVAAAQAREKALIGAISEVEDLLNDWNARDDRDGSDK